MISVLTSTLTNFSNSEHKYFWYNPSLYIDELGLKELHESYLIGNPQTPVQAFVVDKTFTIAPPRPAEPKGRTPPDEFLIKPYIAVPYRYDLGNIDVCNQSIRVGPELSDNQKRSKKTKALRWKEGQDEQRALVRRWGRG